MADIFEATEKERKKNRDNARKSKPTDPLLDALEAAKQMRDQRDKFNKAQPRRRETAPEDDGPSYPYQQDFRQFFWDHFGPLMQKPKAQQAAKKPEELYKDFAKTLARYMLDTEGHFPMDTLEVEKRLQARTEVFKGELRALVTLGDANNNGKIGRDEALNILAPKARDTDVRNLVQFLHFDLNRLLRKSTNPKTTERLKAEYSPEEIEQLADFLREKLQKAAARDGNVNQISAEEAQYFIKDVRDSLAAQDLPKPKAEKASGKAAKAEK